MYCFDHELSDTNWDAFFHCSSNHWRGALLSQQLEMRFGLESQEFRWDAPAPLWSTAEVRTCTVLRKGEALPLQEYGFSKKAKSPFPPPYSLLLSLAPFYARSWEVCVFLISLWWIHHSKLISSEIHNTHPQVSLMSDLAKGRFQ